MTPAQCLRVAGALVLLIAADAFTTIINPQDRTTAVIFADGAGAVVLRAGLPDEHGAVGSLVLGSDGDLSELIEVPAGGSRQRSSGQPASLPRSTGGSSGVGRAGSSVGSVGPS